VYLRSVTYCCSEGSHEVEIAAWGRGKESWSVDYRVFEGDTSRSAVWEKLTGLLNETFTTTSGLELPILQLAIDSGFATTEVYQWARRQGGRVLVVKGDSRAPSLLGAAAPVDVGPQGARIRRGIRVWPVNSGMAKEELYRWLRLDRPTDEHRKGEYIPPGFCHFPKYSDEYFKQITAEQLVTKLVKGYRRHEWQKMRERNEALDCRVYARAAAGRIGIDRFQDHPGPNWTARPSTERWEAATAADARAATAQSGSFRGGAQCHSARPISMRSTPHAGREAYPATGSRL
jgi:phage terminase large subunit GpA-like protein